MPIPVVVPGAALSITDTDTARAEQLLIAILQVLQSGTSGATTNTPGIVVPNNDGINPDGVTSPSMASAESQLVFRQQAIALVTQLLTLDRVSTVPGPGLVPMALPDGTLDAGWGGGGGGGTPSTPIAVSQFTGTCSATDAVGDIVRISGSGKVIAKADPTTATGAGLPAVGVIISKPTTTTAVVQMYGLISGVYSGLTPGRMYYVGNTAQPSLTIPTGSAGDERFIQTIGMAIDTGDLLLLPGTTITSYIV